MTVLYQYSTIVPTITHRSTYCGRTWGIPTPFVRELFGTASDEYRRLLVDLNTASQHLLIEIERMSKLNRQLDEAEHAEILKLFDRQIGAQATLLRHLRTTYEDREYIG